MPSFGSWLRAQLVPIGGGGGGGGSNAERKTISDVILEANHIARGRMPFRFCAVLSDGCPSMAAGVGGMFALVRGDPSNTRRKVPHVNGLIAYALLMHRFQQAQAVRVEAMLGSSKVVLPGTHGSGDEADGGGDGGPEHIGSGATEAAAAAGAATTAAAVAGGAPGDAPAAMAGTASGAAGTDQDAPAAGAGGQTGTPAVGVGGATQAATGSGDSGGGAGADAGAAQQQQQELPRGLNIVEKPEGFQPPANAADLTERFKGSVRRARDDVEAGKTEIHPKYGAYVRSARLSKQRGRSVWFALTHRAALPSRAAELFMPGRITEVHHEVLRTLMKSSMVLDRTGEGGETIAEQGVDRAGDRGPPQSDHIEVGFHDQTSGDSFFVIAYFAVQFAALRTLYLGSNDANFINSMCTSLNWNATGGKSGATFLKTTDQKFIIKDISTTERDGFKANGHHYFKHLAERRSHDDRRHGNAGAAAGGGSGGRPWRRASLALALGPTLPTVLVKILGLFTVTLENGARSKTKTVIIMENLLFGKRGDLKTFDLKGTFGSKRLVMGEEGDALSSGFGDLGGDNDAAGGGGDRRSRDRRSASKPLAVATAAAAAASDDDEDGEGGGGEEDEEDFGVDSDGTEKKNRVLLDNNFMQYTSGFPVPLLPKAKEALGQAVLRDTQFLSHNCEKPVMDYSILVAIDQVKHEISVGIIDYMRHYDLLKFFESHGKRMLQGSATVLHPEKYKERFVHRLESYFMSSPSDALDDTLLLLPK